MTREGERLKPGTNESMFERRLIERLDEDVWTSNGGRELARNRRPIDTLLLGKYASPTSVMLSTVIAHPSWNHKEILYESNRFSLMNKYVAEN